MFKSVFTKYIVSFILIFTVSFLCFAAVIYAYVSEYARSELIDNVQSASTSTKIMLDKMYENYFSVEDDVTYSDFIKNKTDDINAAIEGISKFTDIDILIVDTTCTVVASTESEYLSRIISQDFLKSKFSVDTKVTVKELTDKPSYVSKQDLSGLEENYVLVLNSVDSDELILDKLVQAISAAAVIVFLFGFAACYLISYRMTTPLKEMSKAAKRFALGDFNARVHVDGRDEIAELAKAFNNMAQSLSDLDDQRSTFLANISHDLRTPMTSISGFIDGILDGTIPPEKRDYYLNIVSVEIKRLSRLVRTLLEVSRIEAGVRKFNMVNFDVCEMVMTILFSFEKQIDGKMLDVEYVCNKDHLYVKADSDAIHQVLYNLVDNAVKFSYEKGKLRVSIADTVTGISIEVYNEGNGISKADLPHVFDRFFKADKSRGVDKTGVGLGLFIVKAIMQAHGEMITVSSEEGKYCSFKLTLPKGDPPLSEKRKLQKRESASRRDSQTEKEKKFNDVEAESGADGRCEGAGRDCAGEVSSESFDGTKKPVCTDERTGLNSDRGDGRSADADTYKNSEKPKEKKSTRRGRSGKNGKQ